MNIGEKIKTKRIEKNISIEDLANLINDSTENIIKYEDNTTEPTLDKKIAICSALDLSLSDLSYTIEYKYSNKEKNIDQEPIENLGKDNIEEVEEIVERPFATSSITYNAKIYKEVFQKDYFRFCLQSLVTLIGYTIILGYSVLMQFNVFSYIMIAIAGYSLLKFIMSIVNYFSSKKRWLAQFDGMNRNYNYYKDYIEVDNSTDEEHKQINYKSILRVIEKDDYILCMCLLEVRTILIIDKHTLNDEDLVKVRSTLKESCIEYIEQSKTRKEQQTYTKKYKTIKTINLVLFFVALCSTTILNLIYKFFNLDDILKNHLIAYSVCMIFPLASLIMGIISTKKLEIPAKKNIIVGIIMTSICALFIGLAFTNHFILTKNNNDLLKDKTEEITKLELPETYYTLYTGNYNDIIIDDKTYEIISYQIWNFPSSKETKEFETSLKNNSNWNTNSEFSKYFELTEETIQNLKIYQFDTEEVPTYFLLCNLDANLTVNNVETGNYVYAAYYETNNYMLVINFKTK